MSTSFRRIRLTEEEREHLPQVQALGKAPSGVRAIYSDGIISLKPQVPSSTEAHELGHHFLHHDSRRLTIQGYLDDEIDAELWGIERLGKRPRSDKSTLRGLVLTAREAVGYTALRAASEVHKALIRRHAPRIWLRDIKEIKSEIRYYSHH